VVQALWTGAQILLQNSADNKANNNASGPTRTQNLLFNFYNAPFMIQQTKRPLLVKFSSQNLLYIFKIFFIMKFEEANFKIHVFWDITMSNSK
jgi:hypothetical protein